MLAMIGLVVLTQTLEVRHRPARAKLGAQQPRLLLKLGHPLFNGSQIFRRERTFVGKVVIETMFNHWPNRYLRIWKQRLDGIGQQVCVEWRINSSPSGSLAVTMDRGLSVLTACGYRRACRQFFRPNLLCEARTDGCRHVSHSDGAGKFRTFGAVWKRDMNHENA